MNRNDPCPCGSGKKFKSCCMRKPGKRSGVTAQDLVREARTQLRSGSVASALASLELAVKQEPTNGRARYYLGRLKGDIGRLTQGIVELEQAVRCEPQRIDYRLALGESLLESGAAQEALECADQALELEPTSAAAHSARAKCLERLNRIDESFEAASEALEHAPQHIEALILCGRLLGRRGELEEARQKLDRALRISSIDYHLRIRALYELGVVLDKSKDYEGAWAAFSESGRRQLAGQGAKVDRNFALSRVQAYRENTSPELLERWSAEDFEDERPAPTFLVGFPRSGTTMTEQILAAHPAVTTADEKAVLGRLVHEMSRWFDTQNIAHVPALLERLDRDQIVALRRSYWKRMEESHGGTIEGVLIDKLPLNLVHVGLINVVFPDAHLLVALRDPRDVSLSCFMQWFTLNASMVQFLSIQDTARFYAQVMDLWLHTREHTTLPYIEFRYEDTVTDLEREARRMLESMGLAWDPSLLSFHEQAQDKQISTPSYTEVTQRVHKRSVGRWRNYPMMDEVFTILEPFVEAFGYEPL